MSLLIETLTPPHNACRIADNNETRSDVTHNNCSRAKDSEITHVYIRPDERVSAYPRTSSNLYCALDEGQVRPSVVVRSSAKMRALRDRRLRANADLPEIVDLYAVTNRSLVVDREIPRNRDSNRPVDAHVTTDSGTKKPQRPAPHAPKLARDKTQDRL